MKYNFICHFGQILSSTTFPLEFHSYSYFYYSTFYKGLMTLDLTTAEHFVDIVLY